jgi:hypothetical protein
MGQKMSLINREDYKPRKIKFLERKKPFYMRRIPKGQKNNRLMKIIRPIHPYY